MLLLQEYRRDDGEMIWYFTFGLDPEYPFQGGWVEVIADSREEAIAEFNEVYPPRKGSSLINCAMIYSEEQFKQTGMYLNGCNLGAGCHAVIKKKEAV